MSVSGYNSSDPIQQNFLSSLALGESSGGNATFQGTGGADLSGMSVDQYGFPQWAGVGNSHAAGIFQFQPGTFDAIASKFNLNFSNPADQEAAAWNLAQTTYSANTGGADLETDLAAGKFSNVQTALASIWPSVTGNGAAPQGLAHDLANGIGADLSGAGGTSSTADASAPTSLWGNIENFFVRFGLIILGGIIVIVALWQLLANQGIVPSPADTAKGAALALAV